VRWPRAVLEIGSEQETNAGAVVPATF
jgi:hypothetical protein